MHSGDTFFFSVGGGFIQNQNVRKMRPEANNDKQALDQILEQPALFSGIPKELPGF